MSDFECVDCSEDGLCQFHSDRARAAVRDLPGLWERLHDLNDVPAPAEGHRHWTNTDRWGNPTMLSVQIPCPCQPLAGGPLMPGQATGDKVSGSGERGLAARVDVLSFVGAHNDDTRPVRLDAGDPWDPMQVGQLPLVDTLVLWARLVADCRDLAYPPLYGPGQPPSPGRFRVGSWAASIPARVWELVTQAQTDRLNAGGLPRERAWLLVPALAQFLDAHHDWLTKHELAAQYAAEITMAARHARTLAGDVEEPITLKPGVACKCRYMTLVQEPGKDITCSRAACRLVYRPHEYEELVEEHYRNKQAARRKLKTLPEETPEVQAARQRESAEEMSHDRDLRHIVNRLITQADELAAGVRYEKRPLAAAPVDGDVAPPELIEWLAERMREAGDPSWAALPALRGHGNVLRLLARQYATHPTYRREWSALVAGPVRVEFPDWVTGQEAS